MAHNDKKKKKNWRKVAKKRMRRATMSEAIAKCHTPYPPFNYRWEHVKAVVRLAIKLAKLTGADVEVVEAAAWLHDIAKHKAKNMHPEVGAEMTRKILAKTDFPPLKIEMVAKAIEQHMGLWRETPLQNLEAAVLWDADKLAKIGLTAAFHWTGGALAADEMMTTQDMIVRGRMADWQKKTVASMHTEPAKRAAQERLERYNNLWNDLERELRGLDLAPLLDGETHDDFDMEEDDFEEEFGEEMEEDFM